MAIDTAKSEGATRAIQAGVRDALREHTLMGRSASIWRDGQQIVQLTPPEIFEELKKQELSNGHYHDEQ